ncbi:hypothetical protein [uncultured Corynebacterium sp.]|uniref:hypothetical protein n=1 Tax=uncultured Corynebacterium sp. TaxID=159447 RepID=UPI002594D096|nr:hypothetical protein [uncultured Corynebacterium sp.]
MTSIDDLKRLNTPPGFEPGIQWDGDTGHITVATQGEQPDPEKVNGVIDSSPFLSSDEVQVDWSARPRVSIHHDDNGNLVQAWYKLPLVRRPDRQFDVDELVDMIGDPAVIHESRGTWRTILISDTHVGKSEVAGGGSELIAQRWLQSVANALETGYEGVHVALGGDLIEGYVSQGGRNISETDLTLTEQIRVTQNLVTKTIQMCLEHAPQVVVSVCPGNHGETTRVQGRPMGDSHDIQIVASVQQAFELAGKDEVTFYYPEPNRGDVTYKAGDDVFTLVHGHKFGGGKMSGAKKWWAGQVMNDRPAAASSVLLAGHFHGFEVANVTARKWVVFGPSLETESTWFANQSGATSRSGVVCFDMIDGEPRKISVV